MDYLKTEGFHFVGFAHMMRHGWISITYMQVNSEQLVIFTKKKSTIFSDDGNHECLKAVVPFLYLFFFCWRSGGACISSWACQIIFSIMHKQQAATINAFFGLTAWRDSVKPLVDFLLSISKNSPSLYSSSSSFFSFFWGSGGWPDLINWPILTLDCNHIYLDC